jgi:hypothetical protein
VEPEVNLSGGAQADLADASAPVIAEVEAWEPRDWWVACDMHNEPSNALQLAVHVGLRSRRVPRAIIEQPESDLDVSRLHVDPTRVPQEAGAVVAALKAARDEAPMFIAGLDDSEIERLRSIEIDGEPDALMATCGLIGHWTFHLPAVLQIRALSA